MFYVLFYREVRFHCNLRERERNPRFNIKDASSSCIVITLLQTENSFTIVSMENEIMTLYHKIMLCNLANSLRRNHFIKGKFKTYIFRGFLLSRIYLNLLPKCLNNRNYSLCFPEVTGNIAESNNKTNNTYCSGEMAYSFLLKILFNQQVSSENEILSCYSQ